MTTPYPEALREALIRRFQWEVLFGIENARTALPKGDETYIAGCGFRSLACAAQVLFAVNRRYLINEKGALAGAARLPVDRRQSDRAGEERLASDRTLCIRCRAH